MIVIVIVLLACTNFLLLAGFNAVIEELKKLNTRLNQK